MYIFYINHRWDPIYTALPCTRNAYVSMGNVLSVVVYWAESFLPRRTTDQLSSRTLDFDDFLIRRRTSWRVAWRKLRFLGTHLHLIDCYPFLPLRGECLPQYTLDFQLMFTDACKIPYETDPSCFLIAYGLVLFVSKLQKPSWERDDCLVYLRHDQSDCEKWSTGVQYRSIDMNRRICKRLNDIYLRLNLSQSRRVSRVQEYVRSPRRKSSDHLSEPQTMYEGGSAPPLSSTPVPCTNMGKESTDPIVMIDV